MLSPKDISRIHITAHDFDKAGLNILGYYLKLYIIEQVLNESERTKEATKLVTDLLDYIEAFKNEIETEKDEELAALKLLISDQNKAMAYTLKFTMTLYNSKLLQLKDGPWNNDLKRGLWCCIDLFNCILHLWGDKITDKEPVRKCTKLCKIYLSKLAKGEIGASANDKLDNAIDMAPTQAPVGSTASKNSDHEEEHDYIKYNGEINQNIVTDLENIVDTEEEKVEKSIEDNNREFSTDTYVTSDVSMNKKNNHQTEPETDNKEADNMSGISIPRDDDIANMITEYKKLTDEANQGPAGLSYQKPPTEEEIKKMIKEVEEQDDDVFDDDNEIEKEGTAEPELPQVPNFLPENVPIFIDEPTSEPEHTCDIKIDDSAVVRNTSPQGKSSSKKYSKEEIITMMNKAETIEKIQKLAKYAISALNYDDVPTAKDTLANALDLLKLLE
ncbi:hypothetical protein TPHA_0B04680 [Tetrapisispora phaffii CBS 4417]|uniref:Vta1 C-terminal domain-containing protein n=1 Tax=Tetrapisispora phaffii (strain ATCC 24235 / CBS 4417 / NBRC 1672 / NRRL Y-8282 / UCD 70-5) TaxID=1071381 RepID=G8BQ56_TETPH|nr:hypothetical protein TPHA_0B04680 [Tetrapisispora phaffii CBS 4417]CCE62137.1 hypothetical protein TPHA_0B04680 [Tetrapisispora phaffii CBS 4417]